MAVPNDVVGLVIGRKHAQIREIENRTVATLDFKQEKEDEPDLRMCSVTGTREEIKNARKIIDELIHFAEVVNEIIYYTVYGNGKILIFVLFLLCW